MFKLPTPGGVTRRLIADMLLNAKVWSFDGFEAVSTNATGTTIRVCGMDGWVTVLTGPADNQTVTTMILGPFRRWRLKNAVRRLAAARISKVLP